MPAMSDRLARPRAALLLLLAWVGAPALAQEYAAFRFSDLDLRDPHVFVNFLGCRDVTDTPLVGFSINGTLQTEIQTDGDGDGLLDASYLLEFLPLDRNLPTNLMAFGGADCTAPMASTSCTPAAVPAVAGDADLLESGGTCLAPIAGTTASYLPAIASPTSPCFVSPSGTLQLDIGGAPVQLRDVQLAATFVGQPGTALNSGLLRGFISEDDADATILPSSLPLVGGQTLSSLLPGGTGNCAASDDRDTNDGVTGWWFYLNFSAARVTVNQPVDTVFADGFE